MKKVLILAIALIAVMAAGISAAAQEATVIAANPSKSIWIRGAFGNGIAVSDSDPMDFELIKIGIAGVRFVSDDSESIVKTGVLYFGEDKYRLRNVMIGNASVSADIYDNDTQAGTISLDSYLKGDREVWAGTLTLGQETFNAYVIQVPKVLKAVEKARRIYQYCKDNPLDCRRAMIAVGNIICDPEDEGTTCWERIESYCEENPDDNRCKALRLAYCRIHPEDAECRAEIAGVCRNDATDNACKVLTAVYNKNIQKRPTVAAKMPQWFHTVQARISNQEANAGAASG